MIRTIFATLVCLAAASIASTTRAQEVFHYEDNAIRVTRTTPGSRAGNPDREWRIAGTILPDHIFLYESKVESENGINSDYASIISGIGGREDLVGRVEPASRVSRASSPDVIELVVEFRNAEGTIIYSARQLKSDIDLIVINSGSGDDIIDINSDVPSWINSGEGYDHVYGGEGDDYIENPRAGGKSYGRGGNDVIVGNTTGGGFFGTGIFMFGGEGIDTYITNYDDWIEDEMDGLSYSWNAWITPMDFTYGNGHFQGMSQVTLDQEFFDEYGY